MYKAPPNSPTIAPVNNSGNPDGALSLLGLVHRIGSDVLAFGLEPSADIVKAIGAKLDGAADTSAFMVSVVFAASGAIGCLLIFGQLRDWYPEVYASRGPAGETPFTITDEQVADCAGLDGQMLLLFESFARNLLASLSMLLFTLCPLHWHHAKNSSNYDLLYRLSYPGLGDSPVLVWMHIFVMYYVVVATTAWMQYYRSRFRRLRHCWWLGLPEPRVTTVFVDGIPERYRNDEALRQLFVGVFSEEAVKRVYLLRNTTRLRTEQNRLRRARRWRWSVEAIERAVAVETSRLQLACNASDPVVCSSCAFVTFTSRVEARRALNEPSLGIACDAAGSDSGERDGCEASWDAPAMRLEEAPDPHDVLFDNIQSGRWTLGWYLGTALLLSLLLAWLPLVVFVSGVTNLDTLQYVLPRLAEWRQDHPIASTMFGDIIGVGALSAIMAMLPSLLQLSIEYLFRPLSWTEGHLMLQRVYSAFLMLFVLLTTSLGQGFVATFISLAKSPFGIFSLLATTLPSISRFYLSYVAFGWLTSCLELLRLSVLAKFLFYRRFFDPETAVRDSELNSSMWGGRHAQVSFMLVIVLVFCSVAPIIVVLGYVYFVLTPVTHSYLCCFAEPKVPDTGGHFWMNMMRHTLIGLFLYVVLMLGVLANQDTGPPFAAVPCLALVAWAYADFSRSDWPAPPLQAVKAADTAVASGEVCGVPTMSPPAEYVQAEIVQARREAQDRRAANDAAAAYRAHGRASGSSSLQAKRRSSATDGSLSG